MIIFLHRFMPLNYSMKTSHCIIYYTYYIYRYIYINIFYEGAKERLRGVNDEENRNLNKKLQSIENIYFRYKYYFT